MRDIALRAGPTDSAIVRVRPVGGDRSARIVPEDELPGVVEHRRSAVTRQRVRRAGEPIAEGVEDDAVRPLLEPSLGVADHGHVLSQ